MPFSVVNMKAVEASYKVSLGIAKDGKPHTIGKSLLLSADKPMASSVLGDKEAKQPEPVPLSTTQYHNEFQTRLQMLRNS
jgi:hypothetical protein